MKQVSSITVDELTRMAEAMYGSMVKAVVDIDKDSLVVDMEMHVDGEQYLLENGSVQDNLWGINLYPGKFGTGDFVEFDSMINIRPRQHNMSRGVESEEIRGKILQTVNSKVRQS